MEKRRKLQVNQYKQYYIESTRGEEMSKIIGRLFIRSENETNYRNWDDLTDKEKENISISLNREAAHAGGFREKAS